MISLRTLDQANLKDKVVILRADLNVPVSNGEIQDDSRLQALLPTLKYLLEENTKIVILTHFGRPKGKIVEKLRVDIIANALSKIIKKPIKKLDSCIGEEVKCAVNYMASQDIIMLENTRFHPEEKLNKDEFAKKLASLGDVFVNDALFFLYLILIF